MNRIQDRLKIDPAESCQQIEQFIRSKLEEMQKDALLLGLSGGLDSTVTAYLCVRAVGPDNVILVNLPDNDSKPIHQEHSALVAERLKTPLHTKDISALISPMGVYKLLPLKMVPGRKFQEVAVKMGKALVGLNDADDFLIRRLKPVSNSIGAKGNAYAMSKPRLRMVMLYYQAEIFNLLVVGAANKTEYLTGTFSKWGCDHCADIMPIIHLYRSQLLMLAEYLEVPEAIRTKPADPDTLPGVEDKDEMLLGSFSKTDQILWGLQNGVERAELVEFFGERDVTQIETLHAFSQSMRESPYSLLAE